MLVAGVGNIFRTDDGFATEVVTWLQGNAAADWPDGVHLRDFGTGGLHLAYELLSGYRDVVLIDAVHREDGAPGTVYVLEPDLTRLPDPKGAAVDAHDLSPESVLALVPRLGGTLGTVTVVGCEPASTDDGMGLSEVVAARVPEAGRLVCTLVSAAIDARAGFQTVSKP